MPTPISTTRLQTLPASDDLSRQTGHAIARMAGLVQEALDEWPPARLVDGPRIVTARHNYTLLGYPPGAIVQADAHTQWVDETRVLRTQTTSLILGALLGLAAAPHPITLLAPGLVYRRDVRDRWHCGRPHQMDAWCLVPKHQETSEGLQCAIHAVARHALDLPEGQLALQPTSHPYTREGVEISARWQGQWLEIGEAGRISPDLLQRLGIDPEQWGGLAMGWGLDRMVMVRKRLPDIRLLRDPLPGISGQMTTLDPWQPVSRQPAAVREISLAMDGGLGEEALTERVLGQLSSDEAALVQSVEVAGRWRVEGLTPIARERLGARHDQDNLLLRITWQSDSTSLERGRVNEMMRRLYRALHQGTAWTYCP